MVVLKPVVWRGFLVRKMGCEMMAPISCSFQQLVTTLLDEVEGMWHVDFSLDAKAKLRLRLADPCDGP